MYRQKSSHRGSRSIVHRAAEGMIHAGERCRPLSGPTLALTVLLASTLSSAAQSLNRPAFTLLHGATTLPLDLPSSAIDLETHPLDGNISDESSATESGAGHADADGGDSLSSAHPIHALITQAPVGEPQQPDITANPGRPAMATSALLTPIGYAQFETGFLYAGNSEQFSSRNAEEETMRVTITPRTQFILAGEPVAASQVSQQESVQHGDTTAGMQVVVMPGHGVKPTISASYLRLLRGGNATSLDIGGFANSALAMESADLGHFHVDCNEFLNETEGPVRRMQFGQAVAVTHPVTSRLSATAELRHFTEPLNASEGLSALWAAGYALRPNLVFDTGLVRGFTGASTQWQVASGVTYVLPRRIWGFAHTTVKQ